MDLLEGLQNSLYKVETLGTISKRIVDGPFGSDLQVKEYVPKGIPLIRVHNVKDEEIDMSEMAYISDEKQEQLKRSKVVPGDVILTKAGTVGMAAVVPPEIGEANITSHLAKIELKEGINPYYVSSFLSSSFGKPQLDRWGNKTTRPELNTDEVRRIRVLIPPRPVQDRIAKMMTEAYKERKQKLTKAEELIASIDEYVLERLGITLPEVETKRWYKVSYSQLDGRWDAYHYQPMFTQVIKEAQARPSEIPLQKLGEIPISLAGGATPRAKGKDYTDKDNGIPFLRIQNVTEAGIDLSDVEYVTPQTHNELLRRS